MAQKTNYTIRMEDDKREEWGDFVEESTEFNTLSQLIRFAVDQHIKRVEDREEGELSKEQKQIVDQIKAENRRVIDLINNVQEIAEELNQNQITPSQHRNITHETVREANQSLLREYSNNE